MEPVRIRKHVDKDRWDILQGDEEFKIGEFGKVEFARFLVSLQSMENNVVFDMTIRDLPYGLKTEI